MWEPSSSHLANTSLVEDCLQLATFVTAEMIQPEQTNFLATFWNIVLPYLESDWKTPWMSFDLQEHKIHNNISLVMEHPLVDLWAKKTVQSEIASPIVIGQILIELSFLIGCQLLWQPSGDIPLQKGWTRCEQSEEQSEQSEEQCRVESQIACQSLPANPPIKGAS